MLDDFEANLAIFPHCHAGMIGLGINSCEASRQYLVI